MLRIILQHIGGWVSASASAVAWALSAPSVLPVLPALPALLGAAWLCLAAGCESPQVERARVLREQAMARSVALVKSVEERRDEKLAATFRIIERQHRQDVAASRRNARAIADWPAREFENWDRLEPGYREAIRHQLEGDPAAIERTWPHLIY